MPKTTNWTALALLVCGPALAGEAPRDDATLTLEVSANEEIGVEDVLAGWGTKFGAAVLSDPQVRQVKLRFASPLQGPLSWGLTKQVLDFHDVVVVESQPTPGGPWLIRAHHRRNLAQKEGPPWRCVPGDQLPEHEEMVTAVFRIQHGAGNQIFATVRGLLTRDTNRVGNILYVQGSEVLILVDLASKVRYYAQLLAQLDVPGPRRSARVFQLRFAPAEHVASLLREFSSGAAAGSPGAPVAVQETSSSLPAVQVLADPRTNRLVVSAFPVDLPLVEQVVKELDLKVTQASELRAETIELQHSDPRDVGLHVTRILKGLSGPGSPLHGPARVLPAPRGPQLTVTGASEDLPWILKLVRSFDRVAAAGAQVHVHSARHVSASGLATKLRELFVNEVRIVVDDPGRALLIRVDPDLLPAVEKALGQLDRGD